MTDLSRPFTDLTEAELLALVRADREAEAAAKAATVDPPAPAQAPASDPLAQRRADALAAADAERRAAAEHTQLVAGAKALLTPRVEAQGYSRTLLDEMPEDELLQLAGIAPPTAAQDKARHEADILSDPAKAAAYVREREAEMLDARWWSLSTHERKAEAARLGIDYEHASAIKRREMIAKTGGR